jgi:hypothetical protein
VKDEESDSAGLLLDFDSGISIALSSTKGYMEESSTRDTHDKYIPKKCLVQLMKT